MIGNGGLYTNRDPIYKYQAPVKRPKGLGILYVKAFPITPTIIVDSWFPQCPNSRTLVIIPLPPVIGEHVLL